MQKGFSVIHILLVAVMIGIVGFAGWYVYDSQQKTDKSLNQANNQEITDIKKTEQQKTSDFVLPADWQWYENKELGFKFAYPKDYGNIGARDLKKEFPLNDFPDIQSAYRSEEPKSEFAPGTSGTIGMEIYRKDLLEKNSIKYGPTVKLVNDKWIVSNVSNSDLQSQYKTGEEYKHPSNNKPLPVTNNFGLKIYTFESCDEGTCIIELVFFNKNQLVSIYLPSFDTGLGLGEGPAEPNNRTLFNELHKQILKSVSLI